MKKIKYDAFAYEQPFRPNYELMQAIVYAGFAFIALIVNVITTMPSAPFYYMTLICFAFALYKSKPAYKLYMIQKNLGGRALSFITLPELRELIANHPKDMWLGYGFEWEQSHVQRMFEINKRDWSHVEQEYREPTLQRIIREIRGGEAPTSAMGKSWIHGLEPKEKKIYQPLSHVEGHTLIIGTTGAGKTRLFDLLISQCILRGEAVIIIDPKGDKELAENAKRACVAMGQEERFVFFNPAFPVQSSRVNPLRNFTRVTEIASRIAALMQSANGGNDPFKAFSWQALNNIAQGLSMIMDRPTIIKLKHYLEGGAQGLVLKCIEKFLSDNKIDVNECVEKLGKTKDKFRLMLNGTTKSKAQALAYIYTEVISKEISSPELEGLVSMFQHDETHFSKMVANLIPILNMLTAGELGALLSPDPNDDKDQRPYTDSDRIIAQSQVAYFGLDSLSDSIVGSAIGSMLLADLTAVAGQRYNYGEDLKPVNIFVDEAAETINEPLIAMLNKGRGAKMRVFIATQTIADFSARLGSEDKAMQVLGNVNNTIALRTKDSKTQQYICESMPPTRVSYVVHSQNVSSNSDVPLLHGAGQGEILKEEEADMFPSAQLGALPNLEYIAQISGGKIFKGRLPILKGETPSHSHQK